MTVIAPAPPTPPRRLDGDGDENHGCPWGPRHLPVVVYTRRLRDLFRKRYLLRCWACDLQQGPFETWAMAHYERQELEAL